MTKLYPYVFSTSPMSVLIFVCRNIKPSPLFQIVEAGSGSTKRSSVRDFKSGFLSDEWKLWDRRSTVQNYRGKENIYI
jgi:hypothetical protein